MKSKREGQKCQDMTRHSPKGEKGLTNLKTVKQQEPKLTADMSNDEQFIKDCASGKDAYATIASIAFNKPYEECLEFYLDENGQKTHEVNKAGKERRSHAKIILLGKQNCSLVA